MAQTVLQSNRSNREKGGGNRKGARRGADGSMSERFG
jgi:hypothetical protein